MELTVPWPWDVIFALYRLCGCSFIGSIILSPPLFSPPLTCCLPVFHVYLSVIWGTAVARLRCCATNRKVPVLIPDGVIGIFHWHNTSDRTMALGSTQKWVLGGFPGGKCGWCVRLTTLPPSCAIVMESGNRNFLEPSGPLQACNGTALPFAYL